MIIYFDNKKENLLSIDSGFLKLLGLPTKNYGKLQSPIHKNLWIILGFSFLILVSNVGERL